MKRKNLKILILVGAPGSGKTTFARYFIRTEENWMRLSRDDFRAMHFTSSNLSSEQESHISDMIDASIEALLRKRCNVLIDATHCRAAYLDHYINKFNHLADISFKVFDVNLNTLIDRCAKRKKENGKYIPTGKIKKFAKELDELKRTYDFSNHPMQDTRLLTTIQNRELPKAIICDLDGTLAIMRNRNPFDASKCDQDELNEPVANTLRVFAKEGYKILLVSGRENRYREPTLTFLQKYGIPYNELWMRQSGDFRKDAEIKREIFDAEIRDKYYVEFVLDDRDQVVDLWRKEIKVPCFQVNYGNF